MSNLPLSSGAYMKKLVQIVAALLAAVFITGCASMADATSARGQGTVHIYDQPYDTVWDALAASIKDTDLTVVSADKATGTFTAKRAMTRLVGERTSQSSLIASAGRYPRASKS